MDRYRNRREAGEVLARLLAAHAKKADVIVLALPRGGVPVAAEIAAALSAPLDIFIVRKLGVPAHRELAMGAIASGGNIIFNEEILRQITLAQSEINEVIDAEVKELHRRETTYRGKRAFPQLAGKTVILVDDGIATGATMRAAITSIRQMQPAKIIVAVPVAAADTCEEIQQMADSLVCPLKPANFYAVGAWYEYFDQTTDEEVCALLENALP